MLQATLTWRQEFDVQGVRSGAYADVIRSENATGKIYCRGFDNQGRVIMYMRPRNENTKNHEGNLRHLVYHMERAIAIMKAKGQGVEKICLVIDYEGYNLHNAPPMKTSKATLHILSDYYPERLGVAYFVHPPWIFKAFWKVFYPFIDPVTKSKFIFLDKPPSHKNSQGVLAKNFDLSVLEQVVGGQAPSDFDSTVYLAAEMHLEYSEVLLVS